MEKGFWATLSARFAQAIESHDQRHHRWTQEFNERQKQFDEARERQHRIDEDYFAGVQRENLPRRKGRIDA